MVNASALLFTLLSAAGSLQDPTRPLAAPAPSATGQSQQQMDDVPAEPRLQATFSGDGQPSAILDGRRYVPGDTIGAYRLVRISDGQVMLERQGKGLTLSLFPFFDNTETP
ncbi:MSHA biogenesis protein MshK [Oceanimonas marisflavi]|uniref:MSHA biogenesis protein MshK n=1 Tax=Oceanimonas marisflavi TaxID=2059724 RepID=UPI000D31F7DB|nr:MSHA biogenesis protein MshK [Oceanimonas marisflavi]